MKSLSKCFTAGAGALLLSAGLASPSYANHNAECTITVNDVSVVEGDTGTTAATFTVTANEVTAGGCNGVVLDYAFTSGTSTTASSNATDGTDFTGADGQVTLAAGSTTQTITANVVGDLEVEQTESFVVTLTEDTDTNNTAAITDATGTGTIQTDDTINNGGEVTITPNKGGAGTEITVTATGCTARTGEAALVETQGESGRVLDLDEANEVVDGKFTATLSVPGDANDNATQFVRAFCGEDPGEAYGDVAFDVAGPTGQNGYRMVAADGGIFTFGDRRFHGSTGDLKLNKPIVGGATDVSDYDGYWIVASDGGVFTFNADFHGSLGGANITSPAVEIEPTKSGQGYWIVQADGTVTPFGDARQHGDMRGRPLNGSIIGMAVAPDGLGYWLVGSDGGIFNFGSAEFFGSTGDRKLNAPIVDLAPTPDGNGYYLLGRDGGVFTFGSADFKGSTGDIKLNAPVIAMLVVPNGAGYWLAASDGGIFTFGAVDFLGSMGGTKLNSPVLDLIN